MRKKRTPDQNRRRLRAAQCSRSPTGAHVFVCRDQTLQTVPATCKYCGRRRRFRLLKRLPVYAVNGN